MTVVQNIPVYRGGDQQGKGRVFGAVLESDVPRQRVQVLKDPSDLSRAARCCQIKGRQRTTAKEVARCDSFKAAKTAA